MTPETLAERTDHEWHPNNRKEHTMTEMTPLYIDPRTVPAEPEDPRVELLAEDLEASGQCCFDIWPCDRADEWRNDARNILARLDAAGGRVVTPETLAELRRLLDNGTPGPWRIDSLENGEHCLYIDEPSESLGSGGAIVAEWLTDHNANLIAEAINALPALLDAAAERDALAAKLAEVRALHQAYVCEECREDPSGGACREDPSCEACDSMSWPCPTIRAIGGEQS